ncbi:MAG: class IV adenylate cyclase [Candidatus Moraniibacteriota bacterium]|nr:MAG: class IV adenylate cyclase [Candidatus Moranbacteria bacterium]
MIEVEQKFRLTKENQERIQGVLDARYGKVDAVRQVDTVFLLEGNSLATFKRGDPVMRIRLAGDDSVTLTYKRALDGGEDRMEYELSVDSAETAKCLLQEIGYIPVACVDKRRRTYECGNVVVTLDDVEKLGAFIEIEVLCKDESDISSARQEIDHVAKEFHLEEKDRESRKYDELLADKD